MLMIYNIICVFHSFALNLLSHSISNFMHVFACVSTNKSAMCGISFSVLFICVDFRLTIVCAGDNCERESHVRRVWFGKFIHSLFHRSLGGGFCLFIRIKSKYLLLVFQHYVSFLRFVYVKSTASYACAPKRSFTSTREDTHTHTRAHIPCTLPI